MKVKELLELLSKIDGEKEVRLSVNDEYESSLVQVSEEEDQVMLYD